MLRTLTLRLEGWISSLKSLSKLSCTVRQEALQQISLGLKRPERAKMVSSRWWLRLLRCATKVGSCRRRGTVCTLSQSHFLKLGHFWIKLKYFPVFSEFYNFAVTPLQHHHQVSISSTIYSSHNLHFEKLLRLFVSHFQPRSNTLAGKVSLDAFSDRRPR